MPQFNETSQPWIEITLSRTSLRRCAVIISLGLSLLTGAIGLAVSPLVDGHPVILTPERLAFKHHLDVMQGWIQSLETIAVRLDALSPVGSTTASGVQTSPSTILPPSILTGSLPSQVSLPSQASLSIFNPPNRRPSNLFDRAQEAEDAIQALQAIDRDTQQIETPAAFTRLHAIAVEAVQGFAHWSTQVMDTIGAPTSDSIAAAQTAREAALIALDNLRQALARQQGTQP